VIAVIVVSASALPVDMMKEVTSDIQAASKSLSDMKMSENAELDEMGTVQKTIEGLPNGVDADAMEMQPAVQDAALAIEMNTHVAVDNEKKQQDDALNALAQVRDAVGVLGEPEDQGKELGESQDSDLKPILGALNKVKGILETGTKTSNTQHKLEGMEKEAQDLKEESAGNTGGKGARLGESSDPSGGALSMLQAQDDKEEKAADPDWDPAAPSIPSPTGALSMLKQVEEKKSAPSEDLLHKETEQFKHLLEENKQVKDAEHQDINEMDNLLGLLN
jgi:hypothetical protein